MEDARAFVLNGRPIDLPVKGNPFAALGGRIGRKCGDKVSPKLEPNG
jgi:hypothetical protein